MRADASWSIPLTSCGQVSVVNFGRRGRQLRYLQGLPDALSVNPALWEQTSRAGCTLTSLGLDNRVVPIVLSFNLSYATLEVKMVLKLSFACWDYDRMKAIEDGRVRPEGIKLTFLNFRVEETFFRQLRFQEFDVSELSLSSYVLTLNQDNPPFIALPVFPSRFFRHQSMYINSKSVISKPEDLKGKKVGIPEYQSVDSLTVAEVLPNTLQ